MRVVESVDDIATCRILAPRQAAGICSLWVGRLHDSDLVHVGPEEFTFELMHQNYIGGDHWQAMGLVLGCESGKLLVNDLVDAIQRIEPGYRPGSVEEREPFDPSG